MHLPGFTATEALGSSRWHYHGHTGTNAGRRGAVSPADFPSPGGVGGPIKVVGPPSPVGACVPGLSYSCQYAWERCAYYGPSDPSSCCDYYDEHCIVSPPSYGGNGGGGPVGGPPIGGPKQT